MHGGTRGNYGRRSPNRPGRYLQAAAIYSRITSYNVCYTKLLRLLEANNLFTHSKPILHILKDYITITPLFQINLGAP